MENTPVTPGECFASVGRASAEAVNLLRSRIIQDQLLPAVLEVIPDCALVFNQERQVLAANNYMLKKFELTYPQIIGKRLGEVLGCIHAGEGADGCATGGHCSACGADFAILQSQLHDARVSYECRMTLNKDVMTSLDMEVVATPFKFADVPVTVGVLKDISAEKRRVVLEKIFFHDLMNIAGGLSGLAALLADEDELPADTEQNCKQWLRKQSERLIDEIRQQKKLLAAEKGEFKPELGSVAVQELMQDVHSLYVNHEVARRRQLVLGMVPDQTIITDAAILRRILGNLVKNALEEIPVGETVTMFCESTEDTIAFCVHNPGVMLPEVQHQVFQRSFSSKGTDGRGIGTYSVKLFGERYLKGAVNFVSREPEGTTFRLTLLRADPRT
jgi:hypothetical protein